MKTLALRILGSAVSFLLVFSTMAGTAFADEPVSPSSQDVVACADMGRTVYVSRSHIYHYNSSCSGMKYYTAMSLQNAVDSGARGCYKCVNEYPAPDPVSEPDPAPEPPHEDPVQEVYGYRGFDDVGENDWFVSSGAIDYVLDKGFMSGYAGTLLFGPYDSLTRGQAAVVMYRMETGETAASTDNDVATGFTDAPAGKYYSAAVRWANIFGIVTGYEDKPGSGTYSKFHPEKKVTREELATMIARYASYSGIDISQASDGSIRSMLNHEQVASWAWLSMVWCTDAGVIGGIDNHDGTFSLAPRENLWRSSMAKIATVVQRDVLKR